MSLGANLTLKAKKIKAILNGTTSNLKTSIQWKKLLIKQKHPNEWEKILVHHTCIKGDNTQELQKNLIQFGKKEEQRMKSKIKNWGEELSRLNQRRHTSDLQANEKMFCITCQRNSSQKFNSRTTHQKD